MTENSGQVERKGQGQLFSSCRSQGSELYRWSLPVPTQICCQRLVGLSMSIPFIWILWMTGFTFSSVQCWGFSESAAVACRAADPACYKVIQASGKGKKTALTAKLTAPTVTSQQTAPPSRCVYSSGYLTIAYRNSLETSWGWFTSIASPPQWDFQSQCSLFAPVDQTSHPELCRLPSALIRSDQRGKQKKIPTSLFPVFTQTFRAPVMETPPVWLTSSRAAFIIKRS